MTPLLIPTSPTTAPRRSPVVPAADRRGDPHPVTDAAILSYRLLQDATFACLVAYPTADGGLLCERGGGSPHPVIYRVTAAGSIESDQRYDYSARRFVGGPLPSPLA